MSSRKKPGKKLLQKILTESLFNPDHNNGLNIILNINDPSYCETRAIELIQEAKICIDRCKYHHPDRAERAKTCIIDPIDDQMNAYHDKMKQAISLLAIARAMRQFNESNT